MYAFEVFNNIEDLLDARLYALFFLLDILQIPCKLFHFIFHH